MSSNNFTVAYFSLCYGLDAIVDSVYAERCTDRESASNVTYWHMNNTMRFVNGITLSYIENPTGEIV